MSKKQPQDAFLSTAVEKDSDSEGCRLSQTHRCSTDTSYTSNYSNSYTQSNTVNNIGKSQVHNQDVQLTHTTSSHETASKFFIQPLTNIGSMQTANAQQLPIQEVCYHIYYWLTS